MQCMARLTTVKWIKTWDKENEQSYHALFTVQYMIAMNLQILDLDRTIL